MKRWILFSLFQVVGVALAAASEPIDLARLGMGQPLDPKLAPALADVPDEPGLPRVLLIGDSISIGYTLPVRAALRGKANVHRPAENAGPTIYGVNRVDHWLGSGKWAVIHFNFGLHDLKFLDDKGAYVPPEKGHQVASVEAYAQNLTTLVKRLRETGARLIFATTTPIPAGTLGRIEGGEVAYNDAAVRVMRANGVEIDDLHAFAKAHQKEFQQPHNVHFTPAGYDALAERVVSSITAALPPATHP